ncbi:MAG TPA: hypothetical protein VI455_04165 [Terriglobia bacterium]
MASTLANFNTLAVPAAAPALQVVAPFSSRCYLEILNIGTDDVLIRADQDPAAGDPASFTLPTGAQITPLINGATGLRLLAPGGPGSVSIAIIYL